MLSAFRVVIDAPRPYDKMLEQGLDLVRWQSDKRVTMPLLQRLVAEARKAAADAMAAEGYFSADVRAQIETPRSAEVLARITIDPGPRTRIRDVELGFHGPVLEDQEGLKRIELVKQNWRLPPASLFCNQRDLALAYTPGVASGRFSGGLYQRNRCSRRHTHRTSSRRGLGDSRLALARCTARGTVRFGADRLRNADVEATLGGNHVSAQGALGGPQDTLNVRFSAPRLATLDRRLQGAARGAVQLTGSWRSPAIRFDVTGADLAHSAYGRIKALEAHGALGTQANAPFEIDAALRGISAPQGQLQSATFKLEGTRAAHSALVQAQGVRVDFRARARGGWKSGAGWTGTIQELVNQGEVRVELAAPVSISVGPQRAYAQPFDLLFAGGRLAVRELDYDRGRLSTAGGFTDVPVRPLVTLAGGPGDMAGTLRRARAPLFQRTVVRSRSRHRRDAQETGSRGGG